jgi:DNA adenine methylase
MIQSPLKWVGGKSRITNLILDNLPASFLDYHEPFVGSGAVFLALKQHLEGSRRWYLSDVNPHLICWWKSVQSDVLGFLDEAESVRQQFEVGDRKENYHRLRKEFNEYPHLDTRKAALFMFLCRTSFNGLVRYNTKGHFNAAFGKQKSGIHKDSFPIDREHLLTLSKILDGDVFFSCHPYEDSMLSQGDFAFCDPPYIAIDYKRQIDPLAYCKDGFDFSDQIAFADWCSRIGDNGTKLMVCNHDAELIREKFSNFIFVTYDLTKHFAGSYKHRKKTDEVIMKNYDLTPTPSMVSNKCD